MTCTLFEDWQGLKMFCTLVKTLTFLVGPLVYVVFQGFVLHYHNRLNVLYFGSLILRAVQHLQRYKKSHLFLDQSMMIKINIFHRPYLGCVLLYSIYTIFFSIQTRCTIMVWKRELIKFALYFKLCLEKKTGIYSRQGPFLASMLLISTNSIVW